MLRRAPARPVLLLRAVTKTIRAGVAGCSASVRVLDGVDLLVWPGEHVVIVGGPASGKTTLLLLAAGLLVPDRGTAWRAPGGMLALSGRIVAPRLSAGVRERAPAAPPLLGGEWLAWDGAGVPRAVLAVAGDASPLPAATTRALRLERGRLGAPAHLTDPERPLARSRTSRSGTRMGRVDSAPGAP